MIKLEKKIINNNNSPITLSLWQEAGTTHNVRRKGNENIHWNRNVSTGNIRNCKNIKASFFIKEWFLSREVWQEAGVFVCACVCALAFWASELVNTAAVEWKWRLDLFGETLDDLPLSWMTSKRFHWATTNAIRHAPNRTQMCRFRHTWTWGA